MLDRLREISTLQYRTAAGFLANRQTRTPIVIIWVASFGGALHASVTTYYYLELGASEIQIGWIGFLMSAGSLLLSPVFGWLLDRHGAFLPIATTAGACAVGCLVRGAAKGMRTLLAGAVLLGVGVNLWTVVLAHVANCSERRRRSAVLSGFVVQETLLRLAGKGLFPLWDLVVRSSPWHETLPRYRVHMGICTLFCFYGLVALLAERLEIDCLKPCQQRQRHLTPPSPPHQQHQHQHHQGHQEQQEQELQELLQPATAVVEAPPAAVAVEIGSGGGSAADSSSSSGSDTDSSGNKAATSITGGRRHNSSSSSSSSSSSNNAALWVLSGALLVQAFASTVLAVLWPILLRDRFGLEDAGQFGGIAFAASLVSTAAVAAFPAVEKRLGAFPTAAAAAAAAAAACLFGFALLPASLPLPQTPGSLASPSSSSPLTSDPSLSSSPPSGGSGSDSMARAAAALAASEAAGAASSALAFHVAMAVLFSAAVATLEPSCKSLLSLRAPPQVQGRSIGLLATLGGVGGMAGNLLGTALYTFSTRGSGGGGGGGGGGDGGKFDVDGRSVVAAPFAEFVLRVGGRGGALPFTVVAVLLAVASVAIFGLSRAERNAGGGGGSSNKYAFAAHASSDDTADGVESMASSSSSSPPSSSPSSSPSASSASSAAASNAEEASVGGGGGGGQGCCEDLAALAGAKVATSDEDLGPLLARETGYDLKLD